MVDFENSYWAFSQKNLFTEWGVAVDIPRICSAYFNL